MSSTITIAESLENGENNDEQEEANTSRSQFRVTRAQVIRRQLSANPAHLPVSEQEVINETSSIFRSFVVESYQAERDGGIIAEEVRSFADQVQSSSNQTITPSSPTSEIGRHLAQLGDSYSVRFQNEFRLMITHLDIKPGTAYRTFAGVARRLFRDGISWRRIVTLMAFGYQIAIDVMRSGVQGFLSRICNFIVRFISGEHIANWIARQGGWRAARYEGLASPGWPAIIGVATAAAASVFGVLWLSGYFRE
ncbi:Bcl-2 homologous antagonist/killer [Trichoplax sp. H2]|uniref:Bcl-2 homologous antagonist/killer n=1 Tax=Trichoplax sp. H2 TaxID=287889 RepID=A0ACD6BAH1_9METZ|nr:Bcl-2 homologous antagonist/killer [Trichoplax sp. H2]|eukprot:RDD41139.1 Bcl-2 homologous antagonist/killer [Trichoplax sp. H2]